MHAEMRHAACMFPTFNIINPLKEIVFHNVRIIPAQPLLSNIFNSFPKFGCANVS